jgi:hypothetical protein
MLGGIKVRLIWETTRKIEVRNSGKGSTQSATYLFLKLVI